MSRRKIDADGCWIWTGGLTSNGYGKWDSHQQVHIVAYEIFHGPRTPGLDVMHKCDKRLCFRPDCLSQGSHKKNMEDAATRYRMSFRATNKLTYEKAEEIRRRVDEGETQKSLAIEFGVVQHHISQIISNEKWKKRK